MSTPMKTMTITAVVAGFVTLVGTHAQAGYGWTCCDPNGEYFYRAPPPDPAPYVAPQYVRPQPQRGYYTLNNGFQYTGHPRPTFVPVHGFQTSATIRRLQVGLPVHPPAVQWARMPPVGASGNPQAVAHYLSGLHH
jgi:hypothetical protein